MSDVQKAGKKAEKKVKSRNRPVKPGHLAVGEFTSGVMGASAPFDKSNLPLPVKQIHYEHSGPVEQRILEEERH
jgi:hypothetical protein